MPSLDILYEDNHLLIVNKAAGLPTMGVADDRDSLLSISKSYLKQRYGKPGNVYLGIVSRLDAPVTGVVLMARTSKAAARLNKQFRDREVEKCYFALVEGTLAEKSGVCEHWLRKDERHRRMHVTQKDRQTAQHAKLAYRVLYELNDDLSLVEVQLETGRKHQIRVQLAALGHPVVGDRKYRSHRVYAPGIALHSRRLRFQHPVRDEVMEFTAAVPTAWNRLLDSHILAQLGS